ncbi:undecaprenyl-phosphate glucose phosphotransferase [Roseibium denhamense]|uniref:Undecaprenyl-phosphate glucose phosphotransferase n=1 Tax=Roseibium denhamense TaxID=76305 RepID=A0ABY1NWT4_9HYPH|nr:undecaprenyl-phosphate glucose phosphotransferase [Roseibium denhamense]MTI04836.1 undecaprenyl-phosphate glucose phosphotransferase [Roseibium denhamense]SMP18926.1 Undecaprenyl-phosphate glucose phosphotransferase [Roseibium denhamense]
MNERAFKPTETQEPVAPLYGGPQLRQRLEKHLRHPSQFLSDQDPPAAANNLLSPDALEIAQGLGGKGVSLPVLGGTLRLVDVSIIIISALAAVLTLPEITSISWPHGFAVGLAVLFALAFFQAADVYQVPVMRQGLAQLGRVAAGWTLVFAMFAVLRTTTGIGMQFSESWIGAWYAISLTALCLNRLVVYQLVRHWMKTGRLERRAIIVGGGTAAQELIHDLEAQADNDIRICGIFDDRSNDRSPAVVAGYPKLGDISALVEFARLARIDMLIVCIPLRAENRVLELLKKLWVLPVDIRLSAHTDKVRFRNRGATFIGTVPFVDVVDKPIADWDMVAKRVFDLVFASLAIVGLFPLMIAAAIAVRLDSKGPVLFRQRRYGFNNEIIEILKFRSMYTDMCDADAKKVVTKGDPRVTRVGRFIRKTSIDELPQLFNVLAGSLSLVGPRPHAVNAHTNNKAWDDVVDGYFARHKVKPGVTGWAQINGWRGEVDTPEKIQKRVECDVYYIENWSVLFDLKILFLTPFRLLNTENAY